MSSFDLVASLLLIAAAAGFVNYRFLHMPRSIGLLVIALGLSGCILLFDHLTGSGQEVKSWISNALKVADLPYVLFNGTLGFLLFAGALQVKLEELRSHAWTVLALATVGVLLATILYGAGAWEMFRLGGADVPFTWCIVLGAILAPTDPIAITGLLQEIGLPKGLLAVITGESLFNDGVAVVVFAVALGVADGGEKIRAGQIVADFVREGLGGAALGLITGYIAYCAMRAIDEYQLEITVSLALVTVTYAAADRVGASGPIATVVAGLFIGNRATRYAMSDITRTNLTLFWSVIDEILNTLLFLLIALELLTIGTRHFWPAMMGGGVGLAVLARFISASIPAVSLNFRRPNHFRNVTVLTWGGLRGGISVALALGLPASPFRDLLLQIVYAVAIFTIVVQGLTMPPLMRLLFRERRSRPSSEHVNA
jgi:CPA1 family monovalent cation:H+ antiporter